MGECCCLSWWLAALALIVGFLYWKMKECYNFWESRNIPCKKPTLIVGNFGSVFRGKMSIGNAMKNLYNEFKAKGPYAGFYIMFTPRLIVMDPEIIKNILVKDFQYFHTHGMYYNEKDDPLSAHLFAIDGEKWKRLRVKLSPTFTSGKMKMMYGTMLDSADELKDHMKEAVAKNPILEVKDILGRFSTDIIGSCALGIKCNTLKNPEAEFRKIFHKMFQTSFFLSMKRIFGAANQSLARRLGIIFIDPIVSKFFLKTIDETIEYREKNNVKRNDFLQLLMQLKSKGSLDEYEEGEVVDDTTALTLNEVAAQAFVFFVGGFETSSSTMSFCLYELALNPDIQNKCREEINRILDENEGELTYDCILKMDYLDRVIYETMRKYPTLPVLSRECTKDYTLPGTTTWIPKGTGVFIPVSALHHDPDIYPDPEKFDPDRFTEEAKSSRHHFAYLPFGEGPRICIGMRFGMLQTRLGLITILREYNVLRSDQTQVPIKINPRSFLTASLGGITLKFEPL